MKTKCPPNIVTHLKTLLVALGLLVLGLSSANATTYCANQTSGDNPTAPFYWIPNGGGAYSSSTGKSAAPGVPTHYGAYYKTASTLLLGQGYGIVNTSGTAVGDGQNVVYQVEVSLPSSNVATDIIMAVGSTNCAVGFGGADATNGTAAACTAFQSAKCANAWSTVCYLTNNVGVTKPHVAFTYVSGGSGALRNYADVIRFTQKGLPCLGTPAVGVVGPIATNMTTVTVSGVNASATSIIVYQKVGGTVTAIGTKTTGIAAGNNAVPVTWATGALGSQVAATQVVGSQEGCTDSIWPGYLVGGGSNPRIRVSLNCRTSPTLPGLNNGPVGAPSDSTGTPGLFFMPGVTGTVPNGGILINPSTNWQTIVIDPRTAGKSSIWSGTHSGAALAANDYVTQWAGLESFVWQMDDTTDCGPFDFYVDNIYSGTDCITNFDFDAIGATEFFLHPAYSGFPIGQFEGPESSVVANTYASSSTNSDHIKFQFSGLLSSLWVRHLANGGAFSYPQIKMTEPFQFDILLLPKNQTVAHAVGTAPPIASQTICPGGAFSTSVTVTPPTDNTGTPLARNYTYQWKFNGNNINGATGSSYAKNPVLEADGGTYTVVVTDQTGNTLTRYTVLTVPAVLTITTQPIDQGPMGNVGNVADFSVAASVDSRCPCANTPALTYQWFLNGTAIAGATDPGLHVANVDVPNAGSYTCVVSNTCAMQAKTSAVGKLFVYDNTWTQTSATCQNRTGLLGLYWTNQTSANAFTGAPTWTSTDGSVNFDWSTGSLYQPDPGAYPTSTDYVTVRWVAQLQPYYNAAQTYTFYTTSDDGVRLWVNGQLLIDKWVAQSATEWSGSIALGTGPVDLLLEYFEQTGSASATLSWESPSMPKTTIPQSQMCAADPVTGIPPLTKLTSPANNATVTPGTAVTLTAAVTPESATISKVEFYNNGTGSPLATVAAPGPYTTSWTPPGTGTYNITARTSYNSTHVLNTPANKLTVSAPATSAVTITTIAGTQILYSGGGGSKFVLFKSTSADPLTASWSTTGLTNTATPGSFNIPAVGTSTQLFYRIQSQ